MGNRHSRSHEHQILRLSVPFAMSLRSSVTRYKLTGLMMHVLNNSSSPFKANCTPKQLFMGAPVNNMIGLIGRKQIFTVSDGEIHHPKNVDNVFNTIDDFPKLMDARLTEAYKVTLLRRRRQNVLYNFRYNAPTLQHQEGDWVLVSRLFMVPGFGLSPLGKTTRDWTLLLILLNNPSSPT